MPILQLPKTSYAFADSLNSRQMFGAALLAICSRKIPGQVGKALFLAFDTRLQNGLLALAFADGLA